jgi:hypothetical protein
MAERTLAEVLNDPKFQSLSSEAKVHVFDKYSASDKAYNALSEDAKSHVQEKYLGAAPKGEVGTPTALTPDPERMSPERAAGKEVQPATVDSTLEMFFGKGPQAGMNLGTRIERIAESGLGGMAMGGGTGAALGLIGGPGAPVTVPAGTFAGATIGLASGVLGEIGEQIAAEYGAGRGTQLLTGLVAGGPAGELARVTTQLGQKAGRIVSESASALLKPKQFFGKLVLPEESIATAEARRAAVEEARQGLTRGEKAGQLATEAGETIQRGVKQEQAVEQQKLLERQQRAADLAARSEKGKMGETTALRRQQELADQELQLAKEKGVGDTKSPYDFGTKLREEIQGVRDPQIKQARTEYEASHTAAMDTAAKNEKQGMFWAKQDDALSIKKKWDAIAKRSSEEVKNSINKVIDDIWKKKAIKNEWGETIGYEKSYLPAEGIDQIIRKLGDVGYAHEAEGYKALGADIARELRTDLTKGIADKAGNRSGGFYDWSGLGAAKTKYAQSLENLEKFKTSRGEAATGQTPVDVETLPKKLFGSESGLKEAAAMLGDPKKVSEYAVQFAKNELAGKDLAGVRKWTAEHSFLTNYIPEVKQLAEGQMNRLSSIENKSLVLKDRLSQAGEKTWSANVDKLAQKWAAETNDKISKIASDVGVEGKAGLQKDANVIVSDMLSGKFTGAQLKAASKYLNDNTQTRSLFPFAVADYLSKVSPNTLATEFTRIKPALEGSGLVNTKELSALEEGVNNIMAASRKDPSARKEMPAKIKKLFRSSFAVKTGLGGRLGAEEATRISDTEE